MVDLVYCLTNLLFFDIPLLYCYINLRSSIFLCLSAGDISFFRYFFIMLICNCLWIILLWIFWNFCNSISNFIPNQITSCSCCFLNCFFFEKILNASVAEYWACQEVSGYIYHSSFYLYSYPHFYQKTKTHNLLWIFYL